MLNRRLFLLLVGYGVLYILPYPLVTFVWGQIGQEYVGQAWFHIAKTLGAVGPDFLDGPGTVEMAGDSFLHFFKCFFLLVTSLVVVAVAQLLGKIETVETLFFDYGHILIRLFLGSTLIYYGAAKILPAQFTELNLLRLYQPVGEMSPMSLLWALMCYSKPYSMFIGWAEFIAGVLIMIPRTSPLGAILSLVIVTNVLLFNLAFDVPVKLLSFHLLLFSALLLAPYGKALSNTLLSTNFVSSDQAYGESAGRVGLLVIQVLLMVTTVFFSFTEARNIVDLKRKWVTENPYYGVWRIEGDDSAWYQLISHQKGQLSFQYPDGRLLRFKHKETEPGSYEVHEVGTEAEMGTWHIEKSGEDTITIDGQYQETPIHLTARAVPSRKHPLLEVKFKLIQEHALIR